MTNDPFTELLLAALAVMLLAAAVWDLRTRTIPDPLNIAIALLAPVFWWSAGVELWPDVALRIAAALAIQPETVRNHRLDHDLPLPRADEGQVEGEADAHLRLG